MRGNAEMLKAEMLKTEVRRRAWVLLGALRAAKNRRGGVLRGGAGSRHSSGIKTRQAGFAQGLQWVSGSGSDGGFPQNRQDDPFSGDLAAAAAAFERDMAPVRDAMVAALRDGDLEALRGLRAMLPGLLGDVNDQPALADVLAEMVGREVAESLTRRREDAKEEDAALVNGNGAWRADLHPKGKGGRFVEKGLSRESRTRGQDQFGHLPDGNGNISEKNNMKRGFRVIQFLQQPGQRVEKAMFRADVGAVGMEYGNPDHDSGWGNAHIESKHGKEALYKVPEIIQKGALYRHDKEDRKRYLAYGDSILILKRVSGKQAWTVSSFEDSARIAKITKAKGETP